MATTISIRCDDHLAEEINQRTKPHESLSITGKVTLERGFAIMQAETQSLSNHFSLAEWKVILSSYKGAMTDAEILRDVANNIHENDAAARFGLTSQEADELLARIKGFTLVRKWALLDVAERFWAAIEKGGEISADANGLKRLGVTPKTVS